jgi:hypothetical protein
MGVKECFIDSNIQKKATMLYMDAFKIYAK